MVIVDFVKDLVLVCKFLICCLQNTPLNLNNLFPFGLIFMTSIHKFFALSLLFVVVFF